MDNLALSEYVIYYTSFLEALSDDADKEFTRELAIDKLSWAFGISQKEMQRICGVFSNEDFISLCSFESVSFHMEMLKRVKQPHDLFCDSSALKARCSVYRFFDEHLSQERSPVLALQRQAYFGERLPVILYSIYSYVFEERVPPQMLSHLKRLALANKSPDVEAAICGLCVDKECTHQYVIALENMGITVCGFGKLNDRR